MSEDWYETEELRKRVEYAIETAHRAGIKANSVVFNSNVATVNGLSVFFGSDMVKIPPMVCGLEAFESRGLLDNIGFVVFEADRKKMDEVIVEAQKQAIYELVRRLRNVAIISRRDGNYVGFKEADVLELTVRELINDLTMGFKEVI